MCGICAVFNYHGDAEQYRHRVLEMSKCVRHRGPDWSGCIVSGQHIIAHERLAIVGVESGAQPLTNEDGTIILSVNGEIYNHLALRQQLKRKDIAFKTQSDCEVIIYLYEEMGLDMVSLLDGMFSFVLVDTRKQRVIAARDPIGITTLYRGHHSAHPETLYFASEMKAIHEECDTLESFPPGHVFDSLTGQLTRYYRPVWWDAAQVPTTPADLTAIRTCLEAAVRKRLMSEVPYGVLLSGGLDSSLIASIAVREAEKLREQARKEDGADAVDLKGLTGFPKLHSFSVGLENSPDLVAAREVAKFLGTAHHEFTFTLQEGHDAIAEVIYHLETYDVTTVRASTPMYLLSRKIKSLGVKMVLSGEGSDEIFGGYLYFHKAPTPADFHAETVQRVKNLHTADCLRANKSTMAWGLEARVPFLDRDFLDTCMTVDPNDKLILPDRAEKYILRKAFDCPEKPYLPAHILWRQKEQFSDGVGYSWIDSLHDQAEALVSDEAFAQREARWPDDTPKTKEAYWYRDLFEKRFPGQATANTVVRWIPRADWGCPEDPSGRAQAVHTAAYDKPTA
ncbi:asparagine synthase [Syncephalis pseudoplumigaleata]|uniref:asparagine synthase (glutamine-hydrolyzing) n=1 Tax=Syncephalis pseudoplumigaleata TaxID=1712513 RepID=A0A4P9Z843_9FUNG|nr:asparagine synthase [Syncephalis pseudoplumigaleata]|eukprot:RKP28111.1 asparagine synthase [Syncephalis pseudoplumigaleata]